MKFPKKVEDIKGLKRVLIYIFIILFECHVIWMSDMPDEPPKDKVRTKLFASTQGDKQMIILCLGLLATNDNRNWQII